jgi:UvrB/uvrC motif
VSSDISPILNDWPYRPDRISVRVIDGQDGRSRIQLRLDLGVLQMEFDGRPDGRRIHDAESWLDYHQARQKEHDLAHPDSAPYLLEPEDCAELLREGVQYYHRYLSFWHLERYELCARDTERNLRLFAFVRGHARDERDKLQFDQWRPYVTMMHARAVATPLVQLEQWEAAVNVLDAGIRGIERFLEEYNQREREGQLGELSFLRRWKEEILSMNVEPGGEQASAPSAVEREKPDSMVELQQELRNAIAEERFEDAARLRDDLRRLGDMSTPGDSGS